MKPQRGKCSCCHDDDVEVIHYELFAFGSEGVWLCLKCHIAVCDCIQARNSAFMRLKRDAVLERKRSDTLSEPKGEGVIA